MCTAVSDPIAARTQQTYSTSALSHLSGQALIVVIDYLQVKYEIVSEEELEKQRKQFRNGELEIKIEEEEFNMR